MFYCIIEKNCILFVFCEKILMNLKRKGFSLTELIIAVIIIAVLSIVGVNIYKALLMRAIATEGKTLMGLIARAEKTYWVEYGEFYGRTDSGGNLDEWTFEYSDVLGVDARTNKYFKKFEISSGTDTGLWVQSAIEAPYKDLTVVLIIENMTAKNEPKPIIRLYDMAHDNENTIDEEL